MQQENDTHEIFSGRTNDLARCLGIDVGEVSGLLGISRATLFRYRSGKTAVPTKVLRKLSIVERESGLKASLDVILAGAKDDEERTLILHTASLCERLDNHPIGSVMWANYLQAAVIETDIDLSSFILNSKQLSQLSTNAARGSQSDEKLAKQIRALSKKIDWQANKIEPMLRDFFAALFDQVSRIERDLSRKESQ